MKGIQKNQTTKKKFTIVVYLDDHESYEIDRREVEAENVREAIKLAYPTVFNA